MGLKEEKEAFKKEKNLINQYLKLIIDVIDQQKKKKLKN